MTKLILAAVLATVSAFAQAISGDVVGTVLDESAAAVANATVTARNDETAVATVVKTDATGAYRFTNLPPGTYTISVNASGFSEAALRNIAVSVQKTATVNFTVRVGQVATSVEVAEAAAAIDTTTATVQASFDARQARDLPVSSIGLGVLNLSLYNAGVASNGGIGVGEGPSVGGQRPYNNNFTIEGVDNNNKVVTGSLLRFVPNDAVAEFTVQQNQFSAEFGHSSGGQFNTTVKSGGNAIHGTVYEYMQNRNFNALDQAVKSQGILDRPRYDANRIGGSIGGPVIKNKLFYFGDFEYNPTGQATTPGAPVFTPTSDGYAKLAAIKGLSPTNLDIFKRYATPAPAASADKSLWPEVAGVLIPAGILPLASPNYQNGFYAVASGDYNMSDKDQFRGRYLYNKISTIDTAASLPAFYLLQPNTYYVATLAHYHTFSPSLVNELRLGFHRFHQDVSAGNFKFPGLDSFPNLSFDELNLQIGPNQNAPQFTIQNGYQALNNTTWIKGNHTLKFGADIKKAISPQSFTQRSRGDYDYSTLDLYLRDIVPDSLAQRGLGNIVYYGDQISFGAYVQDAWRVRPNLTVNLGLRYQFTTVPFGERSQVANTISSAPGLLVFGEPQPAKKNFAPRIGIAYSPGRSGKTSIRAGFGISYDVLYDNIGGLALAPQFSTTVDITGDESGNFLKNGGISPNAKTKGLTQAEARAATASYIPNQKLPSSIQWNFGVQQVFRNDYTFEARYLGTRGVHLDEQIRINKIAPVTETRNLPTYLQRPTQAALDALPYTLTQLQAISNIKPELRAAGFTNGAFVEDSPVGNSIYHGLALQLTRRFARGFQMSAAYTWSHLIDDSTADFFTTVLTPRRPQDFQNLRQERSTSALDRRNRFTWTAIYETQWYKGSPNWLMKNLVGNWSVAPIYTYESPEAVTAQSARDANLNGDSWPDRTIINNAGQEGLGSGVTQLRNTAGQVVGYLANNPNAKYIRADLGAYANGGRNTLYGRPINNWDLNILKTVNATERVRVQFSAQLLNTWNHPQFTPGFVNRIDNPVVLNTGPGVRNYLTPGHAFFNNPEAVFGSNPRTIQLALKLLF